MTRIEKEIEKMDKLLEEHARIIVADVFDRLASERAEYVLAYGVGSIESDVVDDIAKRLHHEASQCDSYMQKMIAIHTTIAIECEASTQLEPLSYEDMITAYIYNKLNKEVFDIADTRRVRETGEDERHEN